MPFIESLLACIIGIAIIIFSINLLKTGKIIFQNWRRRQYQITEFSKKSRLFYPFSLNCIVLGIGLILSIFNQYFFVLVGITFALALLILAYASFNRNFSINSF